MFRRTTFSKTAGATIALVLLTSTAAVAGPTTYMSVNGSKSGTTPDFEDLGYGSVAFTTDYGVHIGCSSASIRGKVTYNAQVLAGQTIGEINNLTANCSATVLNLPTVPSMGGGNWTIKVRNTPANPGDPIDVTITGMSYYFRSANCEFLAATPTGVGVNGTLVPGVAGGPDAHLTIDSTTSYPLTLTAYTGAGLRIPAPMGTCGGQILTGDLSSVTSDNDVKTYDSAVTPHASVGPISHVL